MTPTGFHPEARIFRRHFVLSFIASLLATGTLWLAPQPDNVVAQPSGLDPALVQSLCTGCHADHWASQETNPHKAIDSPEWRERTGNAPGCVNCHGDVSAHIQAGGRGMVFAFSSEPVAEQNAVCLNCHQATHPEFDLSDHAAAGLGCTSCHTQHGSPTAGTPLLRAPESALVMAGNVSPVSTLCADCHSEMLTRFQYNERHRLREGILECTSCHDPHAPATRSLLGGFRQEQCLDCHADKGGPFVFEHGASRVDGCTACHSPHGSPNRHLLAHQQTGELCLSCHAAIPQFHLGFGPGGPPRFGPDTQCTNCHSSIHGSNLSPFFLQ